MTLKVGTTEEIKEVARHEFGHVVGNFDTYAYNQNIVGEFVFQGLPHQNGNSSSYSKQTPHVLESVSWNNIMDFYGSDVQVENINYEMILYAFSENKLQTFYSSIVGDRSQAFNR